MYSSLIFADLAADRQQSLIATADAHRLARLARLCRRTQRADSTARRTPLCALDAPLPHA
jgi:hypothetical protein